MKALYFEKQPSYKEDYPKPEPKPHESLIRVLIAAVCNTDREIIKGYKPDFTGVLGHEFVGIVEKSSRPELEGKRVVGELNEGCKQCLYCRTGRESHCVNRKVIGIAGKDGCFAEYMTIATALLHEVPDNVPDEAAVNCEPLAAALEVVELSHIKPSQPVAVIGDGRLAFLIAQVIAINGTPVTVFGRHEDKLKNFKPFANTSLTPEGTFEVVVDATGAPSGLETAISLVRSRGLLILKSTYAGKPEVDMSELVVREITLRGNRCGPFTPALNLLKREQIILPKIQLFPLVHFEQAFSAKTFKVGFDFRNH